MSGGKAYRHGYYATLPHTKPQQTSAGIDFDGVLVVIIASLLIVVVAAKAHEKDRGEDVIESGQDDELRADTGDRRGHRLMRSRTIRIRPEGEYRARHAGERGPLQGGHARVVRDDDRDTSIERA